MQSQPMIPAHRRALILPLLLAAIAVVAFASHRVIAQNEAKPADAQPTGAKPADAKAAADNKPNGDEAPKADKPEKPKTLTVKPKPFKVTVKLSGHLEPKEMTEVKLHPEAWTSFPVISAVEHGALVKKGDKLITLDTEAIDQAIEDRKRTLDEWPDWHKSMQLDLAVLEKSTPLDLAAAKRNAERAEADLKRFTDESRPFAEQDAKVTLTNAQNSLLYASEELRQLKRMYEADDLTEETEEIVLKRTADMVERAKWSLKKAERSTDHMLNIVLPRQAQDLLLTTQKAAFSWEKAQQDLPLALKKKKLEYEKGKINEKRQREGYAKLMKDRKAMDFASPADGIVYYGPSNRGTFSGVAAMEASLKQGGSVKPHGVIMTIVKPGKLVARVTVPVDKRRLLKPGVSGHATTKAAPETKLAATLTRVGNIPMAPGKFDGWIDVYPADSGVVAGMACSIEITAYENANALAVPSAAVHEEDGKKVVYVQNGDNHEAREVKTGWKHNKQTEITEGLKEGDVVLLEKPKK